MNTGTYAESQFILDVTSQFVSMQYNVINRSGIRCINSSRKAPDLIASNDRQLIICEIKTSYEIFISSNWINTNPYDSQEFRDLRSSTKDAIRSRNVDPLIHRHLLIINGQLREYFNIFGQRYILRDEQINTTNLNKLLCYSVPLSERENVRSAFSSTNNKLIGTYTGALSVSFVFSY